jgi:hypothetical protein
VPKVMGSFRSAIQRLIQDFHERVKGRGEFKKCNAGSFELLDAEVKALCERLGDINQMAQDKMNELRRRANRLFSVQMQMAPAYIACSQQKGKSFGRSG